MSDQSYEEKQEENGGFRKCKVSKGSCRNGTAFLMQLGKFGANVVAMSSGLLCCSTLLGVVTREALSYPIIGGLCSPIDHSDRTITELWMHDSV